MEIIIMNILLVDDEILCLKNLEYLVGKLLPKSNRAAFKKAREALEYVKTTPVDIAFLDINMGVIDGITIASEIQALYPKGNIIFCTGYEEYAMTAWKLNSSGYLLKPITEDSLKDALSHLRYEVKDDIRVEFQCFGNFEAYCDGKPIVFKYKKTKELLAYLVDRNGATCTSGEIGAVLFEDTDHPSYVSRLRSDLINTLSDLGVDDVLVRTKGYIWIDKEKVHCDYYDYLDQKLDTPIVEYMSQYSLGEATLARLLYK